MERSEEGVLDRLKDIQVASVQKGLELTSEERCTFITGYKEIENNIGYIKRKTTSIYTIYKQ